LAAVHPLYSLAKRRWIALHLTRYKMVTVVTASDFLCEAVFALSISTLEIARNVPLMMAT
jgi:hypothetical protein